MEHLSQLPGSLLVDRKEAPYRGSDLGISGRKYRLLSQLQETILTFHDGTVKKTSPYIRAISFHQGGEVDGVRTRAYLEVEPSSKAQKSLAYANVDSAFDSNHTLFSGLSVGNAFNVIRKMPDLQSFIKHDKDSPSNGPFNLWLYAQLLQGASLASLDTSDFGPVCEMLAVRNVGFGRQQMVVAEILRRMKFNRGRTEDTQYVPSITGSGNEAFYLEDRAVREIGVDLTNDLSTLGTGNSCTLDQVVSLAIRRAWVQRVVQEVFFTISQVKSV